VLPSPTAPIASSQSNAQRERPPAVQYTPQSSAPNRLPSLDGLRAVSFALVMVNHANGTRGFPAALSALVKSPLVGLSELGLRTFFVISGFLITSLLIRELDQRGTIDWTRFVLRRSARIFPAYFTFVVVVSLLALFGVLRVDLSSIMHAFTFTTYLKGDRSWDVGHLWSMGMQEQFYLIWPLVFLSFGRRGAVRFAGAVTLLFFTARLLHATIAPNSFSAFGYTTSFDTLAFGCLYALHRDRLSLNPMFNRLVESRIWIPVIFLAGNLVGMIGYRPHLLLRLPLVSLAVVLVIERSLRHPEGRAGRILNHRLAVYVGSASFSLYIWQQLFLDRSSSALLTSFPINVLVALAVGVISWHLVEQPAARALRKLLPRHLGERSRVAVAIEPIRVITPTAA
jgi:peptidoglycan/LPS O-acetylase OafA/YrhL